MLSRSLLSCACALLSVSSLYASPKPDQTCKITFQLVYLDRLNNNNVGIPKSSQKDIEKRLGKVGDVCYAGDGIKGDVVFFVHTTPATYHGHHVYTDTSNTAAAATDGNGNAAAAAASSTTTTAVPYDVDYSNYYLDIELPQPNDQFKVLHTFDQKGLYNTIYGIGYGKGKHPIPNLIEVAAKWLHESYLGDQHEAKW